MPMKKPVHPGKIVRLDCLEPLGLTVTAAARVLGVTRQALNNIVNEKAAISPEMAIRLSKAFGSTPDTWVRMQATYDLSRALENESAIHVKRYIPESAA
jgi:antitoxin HigA-1